MVKNTVSDNKIKKSKWYCADFETTGLKNYERDGYVRVWLWSLVGVEYKETFYGNDIESFLKKVRTLRCSKVFFHNLKFDGKFIVDYFFRKGLKYGRDFETIIDGLGSWYEIKWMYGTKMSVKFWDTLKKFPNTSIDNLGHFVGLPKQEKPYFDRYFPIIYIPTKSEISYCIRDSQIIAKALEYDLSQGLNSMTLATDCFKFGKNLCLNGRFYRDFFPILPNYIEKVCRKAYRGGISYLKEEYENEELANVKVYDINSLYPHVMSSYPLPYGEGYYTTEKPNKNELYVVNFNTEFAVKQNKFPFLQIKNTIKYMNNEFVKYSDGLETLTLTSIDYENFKKNYKILDEFDHEYIVFKSCAGLMKPHIDYWLKKKIEFEQQGLPFMRYIAKTMMNGFYGKTALRTERVNVLPAFDIDKNNVSYSNKTTSETEPIYIPYGCFTTAWARDILISNALKNWKYFIYCDTDSIHCFDSDNIKLDIHPTELGKFKDETSKGAHKYARYIKQKTYCHATDGFVSSDTDTGCFIKFGKEITEVRACGLNLNSRKGIKIEDFRYGLEIKNANLKMKTVAGGCILLPTDWKLVKEEEHTLAEKLRYIRDMSDEEKLLEMETEEENEQNYNIGYFDDLYYQNMEEVSNEDMVAYLKDIRYDEIDPYWRRHVVRAYNNAMMNKME